MESVAQKLFSIFEDEIPKHYKTEIIRKSQVQMAIDIATFLESNELKRIMIIEAPVGTGKSLGALIPSVLSTKSVNKLRVVYATATINLQSQLMNSEIPLLQKLFLVKKPILAIGKAHYYCHKEFKTKRNQFTIEEQESFLKFYNRAETGQRNEFEGKFKQNISEQKWLKVALKASKKECERCDDYLSCPSIQHRNDFTSKSNDLIITNHGQLIQSVLNITGEFQQPPMIPVNPGIIIIDEAHHFIENFLNQIGQSFSLSKLREMKKLISKKYVKKYDALLENLQKLIEIESNKIEGSIQGRYIIKDNMIDSLIKLKDVINNSLIDEAAKDMNRFLFLSEDTSSSELEELSGMLKNLLDNKYVKWISYDEKKFSMISESFPTDFRNFINYLKRDNKIIVMSGTLTTNGDFSSLLNQWRLNKAEVITKRFDTPFDYLNQALVYVPEKMVAPNSIDDYLVKCIENIQQLITITEGRSLILTTAKEHMNRISTDLMDFFNENKINLFVQDSSGVEKLTKQFKEDETSVLVGSGSFFSGFSVPGKSLISVILTKLPFPVPDDPFLELIGQGYEDEFFKLISFPHMMNKLNQAAGRLIRDITDFGVFTVLDPRIFTAEYGNEIQEDFKNQNYKITRSLEEVTQFIKLKLIKGAEAQYCPYKRDEIEVKESLWEKQEKIKKDNKQINEVKGIINHNKNETTESQIEFAKEVCKRFNIKLPTPRYKKTPDALYKYLIDQLYWIYEETSIIENDFPFIDESQKKRLLKIKGSDRMSITLPNCSKFGCNGECSESKMAEIKRKLKDDYGANSINFYKSTSTVNCSVSIDPIKIVIKYFMAIK